MINKIFSASYRYVPFLWLRRGDVRTVRFLLLAMSLIIFEAPAAYAGVKLGVFIPTNSDFSSSFAIGLDGRFNVSKQFKLGFDSLFIRDVTGNKYLFDKTEFFAHEEIRSDLFLLNGMVTGWYYFNESLYGGPLSQDKKSRCI